jgi:hypothetical protein
MVGLDRQRDASTIAPSDQGELRIKGWRHVAPTSGAAVFKYDAVAMT